MIKEDPSQFQHASLRDFLEDCQRLDPTSFAFRHGRAFLLRNKYHREMELLPEGHRTKTSGESGGKGKVVFQHKPDFLVVPIRKRHARSDTDLISVGRSQKNDVIIRDGSLTAVQAFFQQNEDGSFTILDAASKNGTFVNDRRVPAWGSGNAVEVETGARVRFGSLEFTFLPAAEFCVLVRSLASA